MEVVWSRSRGEVKRSRAPEGPGDVSVLTEQLLVRKSTKSHRAKGVISSDAVLAEHCLNLVEPGSLLIVQPGAEKAMRGIVNAPKREQLSLFLGT